ncbi:MAG: TraB/GumN family protein [Bacteroidota bacterium]
MMKQEKNNRSLRKNILLFIGVLVSSFILHEVHGQDEKPSLLWEVTGNNIQTSYLYGSIHILPKADYEMKEKVVSAFEKADQVVLELDMDQPGLQMAIMKHMQMKEGMTLDQLFSSEDYAKVDKEVKAALGVGLENFNTFKPFFLISLLTAKLMGKELESFEQTFVQMAKDQQKEVLGLETIEFQASIFDRIPYEEQALDVLDLVNDKERN